MSPLKALIGLLAVLCIVSHAFAAGPMTEAQKKAIEKTLSHQIAMFDRVDIEGWKSDLAHNAVVEGLGSKYAVPDLHNYFKKMDVTRLKSKITAPFSISDYHAVFARTIEGTQRNGCYFSRDNVVSLVRFGDDLKVISWQDMWTELETAITCPKTEL